MHDLFCLYHDADDRGSLILYVGCFQAKEDKFDRIVFKLVELNSVHLFASLMFPLLVAFSLTTFS